MHLYSHLLTSDNFFAFTGNWQLTTGNLFVLRLLCPPPLITLPRPMKAERRHELKTNALAKNLEQAPEFFQKHGSQLLLGLVLCLLAFILVRNHYADKTRRAAEVRENMGTALDSLSRLRTMSPFAVSYTHLRAHETGRNL